MEPFIYCIDLDHVSKGEKRLLENVKIYLALDRISPMA